MMRLAKKTYETTKFIIKKTRTIIQANYFIDVSNKNVIR